MSVYLLKIDKNSDENLKFSGCQINPYNFKDVMDST